MKRNYIALHIHLIWTTKNKIPFLEAKYRYPLLEHIRETAIVKGIKVRIVNGVEDHLHCLVSLLATQSIADVMKSIKGESSRWITQQGWFGEDFEWQDGYGAISVSPQHFARTTQYIYNQEVHHASSNLEDELKIFEKFADIMDG